MIFLQQPIFIQLVNIFPIMETKDSSFWSKKNDEFNYGQYWTSSFRKSL